ncbi:MAG: hypothetical protein K0R73_882, partial [Candidatus Midichloriaceae bacterium]|nr:hypothetical protein [Candidatus Midichloriaceae bacterium]
MVMIISKFLSFETPNLLCKRLPNYRLKPVVVDGKGTRDEKVQSYEQYGK